MASFNLHVNSSHLLICSLLTWYIFHWKIYILLFRSKILCGVYVYVYIVIREWEWLSSLEKYTETGLAPINSQ